jgi:hypothetical protein
MACSLIQSNEIQWMGWRFIVLFLNNTLPGKEFKHNAEWAVSSGMRSISFAALVRVTFIW